MQGGRTKRGTTLAIAAVIGSALAMLGAPAAAPANLTDWADAPDPFILHDRGRYYAYSTNADVRKCNGTHGRMYVPSRSSTLLHAMGTLARPACFSDVLPGGPGAWATRSTYLVWAPTVFRNPATRQFVLLYAGQRAGSGQMCIGRAVAAGPGGPFAPDPNPLICPSGGNWALDPNAIVFSSTHHVYLQWRQDLNASVSRLFGAEYSHDGRTRLTPARLLMSDGAISWDGPYAIENPAIDPEPGIRFLYYSGNDWDSNNSATGVASCGPNLAGGGLCTTLYPNDKPWLGNSHRSGGTVLHTPENLTGPGGMSIVSESGGGLVRASDGSPYVAMHFLLTSGPPPVRPMAVYKLFYSSVGPVPLGF